MGEGNTNIYVGIVEILSNIRYYEKNILLKKIFIFILFYNIFWDEQKILLMITIADTDGVVSKGHSVQNTTPSFSSTSLYFIQTVFKYTIFGLYYYIKTQVQCEYNIL